MTSDTSTGQRRTATYERVSSDDQRKRETIATQTEHLARRLAATPDAVHVGRFADDGVSGAIPLFARPAGRRLLDDAEAGLIDEVWVYKIDRLGRDAADLITVHRRLKRLGIKLVSMLEGEQAFLSMGIISVVADSARQDWLLVSYNATNERAEAGAYLGGPVPYGYRVEGERAGARLVPDENEVWNERSAVDIIRLMFEALGLEGRSCRSLAAEFNALGVPTSELLPGRKRRRSRTQPVWRPGRILQIVKNPMYRGEKRFGGTGRHKRKWLEGPRRDAIIASAPALVSPELWQAAQDGLRANRTIPKNTRRRYLLRGTVRCGICGLAYCGTRGRGDVGWYRCTGQMVERGPIPGRCWGQSVRTDQLDPVVWADIESWLRDPGDLIASLEAEANTRPPVAVDGSLLSRRLDELAEERATAIRLAVKKVLSEADVRPEVERIDAEVEIVRARLAELEASAPEPLDRAAADVVAVIRARLDAGLSDEDSGEIARLLVRIVIDTQSGENGKKQATAWIEYRFPVADEGVVPTRTGTGSSPPPAGSAPGRSSPARLGRSRREQDALVDECLLEHQSGRTSNVLLSAADFTLSKDRRCGRRSLIQPIGL